MRRATSGQHGSAGGGEGRVGGLSEREASHIGSSTSYSRAGPRPRLRALYAHSGGMAARRVVVSSGANRTA